MSTIWCFCYGLHCIIISVFLKHIYRIPVYLLQVSNALGSLAIIVHFYEPGWSTELPPGEH